MTVPTDPVSTSLSLTANTVGSWTCPQPTPELTIVNQGAGDTWITVNGPAPTVAGNDEWFLPTGDGESIVIQVATGSQAEVLSSAPGPFLQAITATAGSIYIQAQ